MMKVFTAARFIALVAMLAAGGFAQAQTTLNVYTAIEAEDLPKYAERFNKDHPEVRINWIHESTGVITERLLAEKEAPQADVVWGLAATSLLLMKSAGMLQAYAPRGLDKIGKRFRDSAEPPTWVGMDAWVAALCVNTIELRALKLAVPTSWKELANPIYKGHVAMPDPNSSGTGFLNVAAWLQIFGDKDAWAFMDALHANITQYTHSGSKPCVQAARGEVAIGISFAFRAARSKASGAPIDIVIPSEGIGWGLEAAAIIKGSKNLDAAKVLLDWSVSEKASEMYNEGYAVLAAPGRAKPVEYFPATIPTAMIDIDFQNSARNRGTILSMWRARYASKSEPKPEPSSDSDVEPAAAATQDGAD